ncbi:hypothetical protein IU433_31515 [Nocardia puris]|uniref:hypothetical protein n=1 Tax=Nocardia puris TaxID=208602 RepID=UPI001893FCF6|nr:hypothetical protein [Nocardia puris]MBF6215585.1 hypothetical protein [Nocardia puris]MBF6370006.1 hypothetical protein [Nocardia puris]MBF6463528.1 hypothetical protein [Nocardia puris]
MNYQGGFSKPEPVQAYPAGRITAGLSDARLPAPSAATEAEGFRGYRAVRDLGTCTDQVAGVLHLHEPLKTKDCSDPSAIFKVVESEIITGTGLDVNCDAGVEMRITTQGKHYGKGATAHSCAALNLIVRHCYSRSGTYRKYETDCRAGGRLHQKIEGIADEDACDFLAPEEPGAAMEWIPITMIDHVDEREPATYCFVPVS